MAKRFKTGGRQSGTPNKVTKELKEILKDIVSEELEHLREQMKNLSPYKRFELLIKILPYVVPKMNGEIPQEEQDELKQWVINVVHTRQEDYEKALKEEAQRAGKME
jgi:hypothetical protein